MTEDQATRVMTALDAFLEARENKRNNSSEATRFQYQREWAAAAHELARALLPIGEANPAELDEDDEPAAELDELDESESIDDA